MHMCVFIREYKVLDRIFQLNQFRMINNAQNRYYFIDIDELNSNIEFYNVCFGIFYLKLSKI